MNTTMIAVNAVNTAFAIQEQQEAMEANEASCRAYIRSFDRSITTATSIPEKQQYARCVERLYPEETIPSFIGKTLVGTLILVLIASIIIGVVLNYGDMGDRVAGGLLGAVCGMIIWAALTALAFGLIYLAE